MELIERINLSTAYWLLSMDKPTIVSTLKRRQTKGENLDVKYNRLKNYLNDVIKSNGIINRVYSYSIDTVASFGGRLLNGSGLQGMMREIRGCLVSGLTTDIDMKNAHPVILRYICSLHNIRCPNLNDYIVNRDTILGEFPDKDKAKSIFLSSINDSIPRVQKNKTLKLFDLEMKNIQTALMSIPEYDVLLKSVPLEKSDNIPGSFVNRLLCSYENRILQKILEVLKTKDIEVCTLMFDGCLIYGNHYNNIELLREIENEINTQFDGMNMELTYKQHSTELVMPSDFVIPSIKEKKANLKGKSLEQVEQETRLQQREEDEDDELLPNGNTIPFKKWMYDGVKTDADAAAKLFSLNPNFITCHSILYAFDYNTNMWTTDQNVIYRIYNDFAKYLMILVPKKDEWVISHNSYGTSSRDIDKLHKFMKTVHINDSWLDEVSDSSLGKILFTNGYYDFNTLEFNTSVSPNIVFFGRIPHTFKLDGYDSGIIESIKQRLFYNSLGNKEVGDYLILNIARALSGECLKRFMICVGEPNCGKGMLTKAIEYSFGNYFGTFNCEDLALRDFCGDEAQRLRWALLHRNKRIIISNEVSKNDDPKKKQIMLDGNLIKKLASGGDPISGRVHCGNETKFRPHFMMFIMVNDVPKISPMDAALIDREKVIEYQKQYVDNPTTEFELLKDEHFKNEIEDIDFQQHFIGMLLQAYQQWCDNGKIKYEPLAVVESKNEWADLESVDVINLFMKDYEFTNNPNDFVDTTHIKKWADSQNLNMSFQRISKNIMKYCKVKKLQTISDVKNIRGKSTRVWRYLKMVNEIDEIIEY